ncbi:MAG: hypothetical protein OEM67_07240 [Thermoleophilia bacterium]|nr:hypothetical protein [Thermoleophilia bacterium]MDH3724714.1 hypothetical protein [Thermoleophilia bacterium]
MYFALAVIGVVIFGAGLGVILAMARGRLDQDQDRPMIVRKIVGEEHDIDTSPVDHDPRPSLLGTPELRLRAMWLGVAFSAFGVILLMAGGSFVGELMFLIGLMVALQATILAGMARLRGQSADAPSDS